MNFSTPSWLQESAIAWLPYIWLLTTSAFTAIIHIGFSIAVLQDSHRMLYTQRRSTFLVGGSLWAFATLLGGVITVGIYWVIHHSALRPGYQEQQQ
jgi:hypothetical protein